MLLNTDQFPRTVAFLNAMPAGLESYPDCQMRGELVDRIPKDFPQAARHFSDGGPMQDLVVGPQTKTWYPEAAVNAALLVARDLAPNDDAFFDWIFYKNVAVFNRPIHRALMHVLSPHLLLLGAERRWATFHRGTKLEVQPTIRQGLRFVARTRQQFPPNLRNALHIQARATAMRAAVDAAGAQGSKMEVVRCSATEAEVAVSWVATESARLERR